MLKDGITKSIDGLYFMIFPGKETTVDGTFVSGIPVTVGITGRQYKLLQYNEIRQDTILTVAMIGTTTYGARQLKMLAKWSDLGVNSTADLAKGTTIPQNLRQQLAVEEVISDPLSGAHLRIKITDPRWPASKGWIKMQRVIKSGGEPINVHYLYQKGTGLIDDVKIVLPGPRP